MPQPSFPSPTLTASKDGRQRRQSSCRLRLGWVGCDGAGRGTTVFDTDLASLALIGPPRWVTTVLRQLEARSNAQLGHVVLKVRVPGPCPAPLALHPFACPAPSTHCIRRAPITELNPMIIWFPFSKRVVHHVCESPLLHTFANLGTKGVASAIMT